MEDFNAKLWNTQILDNPSDGMWSVWYYASLVIIVNTIR